MLHRLAFLTPPVLGHVMATAGAHQVLRLGRPVVSRCPVGLQCVWLVALYERQVKEDAHARNV